MFHSGNFGGVASRFGMVFPWFVAQFYTSEYSAVDGIPWHLAVTQYLAGQPHLPLLFRPPHSEHHPDIRAHVFHLKAFRAAEAKGHPVLSVSSCSSGFRFGQSRACSHLSALNTGGHGSLGKACFIASWRWQPLSAFPALLLKIVFCFLHLQSCVNSMLLKNNTWEKNLLNVLL